MIYILLFITWIISIVFINILDGVHWNIFGNSRFENLLLSAIFSIPFALLVSVVELCGEIRYICHKQKEI